MILFCVAYAGGSAGIYNKWINNNMKIEVVPIELAGRGTRIKDELYSTFYEAVEDIYSFIKNYLYRHDKQDYALFGHSMGSWLIFETAKLLFHDISIIRKPVHLFFSANCCPECNEYDVDIYSMTDLEFKQMIINYGGIPDEILSYPEILDFYLPILKSDYSILYDYKSDMNHKNQKENIHFDCNITVMNGINDEYSEDSLKAWSKYAGKGFEIINFNDGHFFINSKSREVLYYICNVLDFV